ncbi:MAG: type II toxin-antitoxin system RelE family toxin [Acidimicrobiales bacterium]
MSAEPPYTIEYSAPAWRALAKLDPPIRQRVSAAVEALAGEPRPAGATSLVGTHALRIRVGDYRVVYCLDERPESSRWAAWRTVARSTAQSETPG